MPKLFETMRIPQEHQLVSWMKEAHRISGEQEQNNLINGRGVETDMLISASVPVPIGPVQRAPKMKELESPALYRGPVRLLTASQVK